jgi:hypothetical protein
MPALASAASGSSSAHGGLVRDERVDQPGMAGGQVEPDLGAAAAAQHVGGLAGDGGQQGGGVVAVDVQVLVPGRVVGHAT